MISFISIYLHILPCLVSLRRMMQIYRITYSFYSNYIYIDIDVTRTFILNHLFEINKVKSLEKSIAESNQKKIKFYKLKWNKVEAKVMQADIL